MDTEAKDIHNDGYNKGGDSGKWMHQHQKHGRDVIKQIWQRQSRGMVETTEEGKFRG